LTYSGKKRLRIILSAVDICLAIPGILVGGYFLGEKNYAFSAVLMIIFALIPFFLLFENRALMARELMPIAVMTAIAVVGRAAFFAVPQFKPIIAIIIITGAAFGAEAGFLSGSLSMLISNFLFGQGLWTPWQMFAAGLIGYISGLIGKNKALRKLPLLIIWGLLSGFIYGIFVDSWSLLAFGEGLTLESALTVYLLGLPYNAILAGATAIFIALLAPILLSKLERLKTKYGLIGAAEDKIPVIAEIPPKNAE
jgi:uncharacterized membrane protein